MSEPRIDPQWAEVERMLQWIGGGEPGERQGTLFSDEARLILRAVGRPEALDRDKIAFLITGLCERHLEYDPELGICNAGTVAFKAADQIIEWVTGAELNEPDNETLEKIGALGRPTKVGKHQATNWVHLRQTVEALDAAGQRDAADTLIWAVWHEVNGVARAREYHRIAIKERNEAAGKADRLHAGIAEIIAICDQDARDQESNAKSEGWGRGAKAYAEGRSHACRGIAARLQMLLVADPLPAPATSQDGEAP